MTEIDVNKFLINPYKYLSKISDTQLEKILIKLSDHYYNSPSSLVSDEVFDDLKDELYKRNPDAAFFTIIGSEVSDKNIKVKLPYQMFSLSKIKPDNGEFEKWIKKYTGKYAISDKLDGISGMIVKQNNKVKLYTRGNGYEGQDITKLLKYINVNIKNIPDTYAIRGEMIISKENFNKIPMEHKIKIKKTNTEAQETNPRSFVSGIINSNNINVNLAKYVDFVAYSVVFPRMKQSKQYKFLESIKMKTVKHIKIEKITISSMIDYFKIRRQECEYEIDGIVIYDNSEIYENPTDGNPKYGVAFKSLYAEQIAIAEVIDVLWDVTRLNAIKPRVKTKPVEIQGTTIEYFTGHNAKYIYDNNINKGTILKVSKSGSVIPFIVSIVKPSATPKMPNISYYWNDTEVDIYVDSDNQSEESQQETERTITIKQLTNTCSVLKVKYFSEGFITRLVDNNINTLIKIININTKKLESLIGDNMGHKIYDNLIMQLNNTTLPVLMAASNCFERGMGVRRISLITKNIHNIMTDNLQDNVLYEKIININTFSDITANVFIIGFHKFKKYFKKLQTKQSIVNFDYLIKPSNIDIMISNINSEFKDKKVNITGFRDKKIINYIESNGGSISANVSKNTYMVICNDKKGKSSKIAKAIELNIPLLDMDEFYIKYLS